MSDFLNNTNNDDNDLNSHKFNLKFDLKTLLLPIMQKNRRTYFLSVFLLLFHFLTIFALQIRSSDFPTQNGLMPSIHFVISKFNLIYLLTSSDMKLGVLYGFTVFNINYMMSMVILGFLGEYPRKHFLRVFFTKFHVYCFRIYNMMLLVPSTHIAAYMIFNDISSVFCKAIGIISIISAVFIANFIEYARININFKCEDQLDSRVDLLDKIILNFKIITVFMAGVNFYIDYFLIVLFCLLLADYFRKVSFYVESISMVYLSCIGCFFFSHLVYLAFYTGYINLLHLDISYLLFFGISFIIKTCILARPFLIIHKLKMISRFGIRNKLDFDIYIRECYSNLKNFRIDLDSKILFLSFFSIHQNRCRLKDCACKIVKNNNEASFLKNKKTFKRVIESYFIEYLMYIKSEEFEEVFLMYCSFIASILKIPSKALNLLLTNKHKIKTLKNKILIEILTKKSKKSLEKKLLNNDQYAQSFSTVIVFDHQVRLLESWLRKIIIKELSIGTILIDENDLKNTTAMDKFFNLGKEIIASIESSKELIKKLFDRNVNNIRLVQMTTLIIKYLSEDMSFRNFYKQLNIKRINQQILKRKKGQDSIDIFENDAGVVFLSLSKQIGLIKKFSKNIARIFGCDSIEMKNKNINEFMPLVFSKSHNEILENFIKTGKAVLTVSNQVQLYGVTKLNFLMHLNMIIRLDTFFGKDFMIGAYMKSLKNTMSKTILLDIHGNFINCSKEVANYMDFTRLNPDFQHRVSMILLIPDIMEKLLPFNYEEVLLKRNTDFKMKGFMLTPIEISERHIEAISIKKKVYSSFKEFQETEDSNKKFQELREEVSNKMSQLVPQDFRFYRIHFTLIVQNFSNNFVNVRLIEIYDIFEIKDLKLQIQYISRKNKKFKEMITTEHNKNNFNSNPLELNSPVAAAIIAKPKANSLTDLLTQPKNDKNKNNNNENNQNLNKIMNIEPISSQNLISLDPDPSDNLDIEISATELDNKPFLSKEESITNDKKQEFQFQKKEFLTIENDFQSHLSSISKKNNNIDHNLSHYQSNQYSLQESNENNSLCSEQKLLSKGSEEHLKPSLTTIEQEGSEISFERDDHDFEERISLISNNQNNNETSDDEETQMEENTQTNGGSQISRVSSQGSGDGKKSTLELLNKVGMRKIYILKLLNIGLLFLFLTMTISFFVIVRTETFTLENTLKNSGVFHNQLSPLCILIRDSMVFKFLYAGLLEFSQVEKTDLIAEIKKSIPFNNKLLLLAYQSGVAQADSSVDFIYSKYVDITIENVTMYTIMLKDLQADPLIQHEVPFKLLPNNLISMNLNIQQCILFFIAAAEHLYYSEILGDITNATDAYNYIFFLHENILKFINNMLQVLEANKEKINGSVNYLNNLNLGFFIAMLFSVIYGVSHLSFISIKSKYKANKFCALFFHFQENELDERSNKLRHVLDRYFNRNSNSYTATDNTNISLRLTENSKVALQNDILNTDKMNFLRSDLYGTAQSKTKRHHKGYKRSNSINQIKGKKFQQFLFIFFIMAISFGLSLIAIYMSNYFATNSFASNVIEITGDLESVETYVITIHIQYAINSILLGLFDETNERKQMKMALALDLLSSVDSMQSRITDLNLLFKTSSTERILTQLKYEFFTKDICELVDNLKTNLNEQTLEIQEIASRLQDRRFCQGLLKKVLTKGSTSFAFEINEIFQQWQDYIRNSNFSREALNQIIETQEFIDINYALPYVYALGLYDITLMMSRAESYFDEVRNSRLLWFILAISLISLVFTLPFRDLTRHLNSYTENAFSLIKIFPYSMISNNKMLDNKITRISKQQKI